METNIIKIQSLACIIIGGAFVTASPQFNDYNELSDYETDGFAYNTDDVLIVPDSSINEIQFQMADKALLSDKQVLDEFIGEILSNCKSMKPEFSKLVDDNFWDLI